SIVDRTQMAALRPAPAGWQLTAPVGTGLQTVNGQVSNIPVDAFQPTPANALGAPTTGYTFGLQPGMTLTFDAGKPGLAETVVIQSVDTVNNNFTAYFNNAHAMGANIALGGPRLAGTLDG